MNLTGLSLRHRVTVFFLTAVLVVVGLRAYLTVPRESAPDVEVPVVIVVTPYPGAAPADVESQITRPLERELQGLDGLKVLTSRSEEGASVVTAEFVSGTSIDTALQKVRDRVDRAEVDFPTEAEDPLLQEINFSDIPVVQVHLAGPVGPVILKRLAEDLQDRVEGLPGVLKATLVGGLEREVRVEVDPELLRLYSLSLNDVIDAVSVENVSIPGGELDLGETSFAVRVPGEVDDPRQIGDFVIRADGGAPVFVRDVAQVRFGFEDRTSFARIDGQESVALAVQKRVGANIIEVADRTKALVEEEQVAWPEGVTATVLGDLSRDIRRMVKDLENNILSGLVLVVLVLMFVLGFRNALFVGLAIPFSMLLTFTVVQLSGTTLNMVVLFSLVLAVGMLVDNAVVVIENIYRHMQEGKAPVMAAREATSEVAGAITVSTFTSVGAFLPLLFWPGIIGDFMVYLPGTVSVVLLASLVVAFTINPTICSRFMRVRQEDRVKPATVARLERRQERLASLADRMADRYRRLLEWSLDHRWRTLALSAGALVLALALFAGPFNTGIEFFPETEPPQIFVNVELPPGTRLERTDAVVREIEARLADTPDLRVLAAAVGAGSQSNDFEADSGGASRARLTLDLLVRQKRSQSSDLTLQQVRDKLRDLPGVRIDVDRPTDGPPVGDPLVIEIRGDDFARLGEIAGTLRPALEGIPGLVSLDDDFDLDRPEVLVRVDRTEAARLGLSTRDIATTVRTAINGTEASTYRYGEDDADITVRLQEEARTSLEQLARLTVVNDDGTQIPLSAVATLERSTALTAIRHKDQQRMVTISGKVTSPELAEPVRQEARQRIEALGFELPAGYQMAFAGQSEDEEETKLFLEGAFGYALLLVLILMVAKFDSLAIPLIILTSVVMSMVGVLLGLMITGLPFGIIMTGLGVISLAGIVVNNAIVLLDYGEKLWKQGLPRRQLVVDTGLRRLRPVLLTALTTILGLIPLSTGVEFDFRELALSTGGESSQWWKGMGVAVIFGLTFATFLTLVVVPVLYDLLLQVREKRAEAREEAAAADPALAVPFD